MSKPKSKDFHRRQHKLKKHHKKMAGEAKRIDAIVAGFAKAKEIHDQLKAPESFAPPAPEVKND